MTKSVYDWLNPRIKKDDIFDEKDYEFTNKVCHNCIVRKETSAFNHARKKKLTFLCTIQHYTNYKCFDEKSVNSIKQYISLEPKGRIDGMNRCICGMQHDELKINLLKVFDKNLENPVCFVIGGDCLKTHFGDGGELDYLLTKERCQRCKAVISKRHKSRPHLCIDCNVNKKKLDEYLIKFGKYNYLTTFKNVAEDCQQYCEWLLETYHDDTQNKWIKNNRNATIFCRYLLDFYYDFD